MIDSGRICPAAILALLSAVSLPGQTRAPGEAVRSNLARTLASITAANLKGDLSFLASDALEGRYTPSPGLEVAAEFIASQFRAAGLEPGGDSDYFQTAEMIDRRMGRVQSDLILRAGVRSFTVPADAVRVSDADRAAQLDEAPFLAFGGRDPDLLKGADLSGKVIIAPAVDWRKIPREQRRPLYAKLRAFDAVVASSKATAEILVSAGELPTEQPMLIAADEASRAGVPKLVVSSEQVDKWMAQPTPDNGTLSVKFSGPEDRKVVVKNVIAVLRGSDAQLRDSCVLVTAHYDHLGTRETAGRMANPEAKQDKSDAIYNGANDDGSGTVSVIEIARALAKLKPHPRRSIVFMTFFGEERGELGSQYYTKHPKFPLAKTAADVNLEQVGRTDSTVGTELNNASVTGYDYSDVTKFLEQAGRETGIRLYMDKTASDAYFTASDNAAFAEAGVPAHSVTVAFDYPDYHGVGDEWQKINYENMARVDRMIALGVVNMANRTTGPRWNAQNPKTAPFREAERKLLGQ